MTYSDSQLDTLLTMNIVCSVLSLIGSLTIIICYVYFRKLRSFAFRLVFFVSLSDSLGCVFRLLGNPDPGVWCDLQGFGGNLWDLCSFGWVTAIAVVINFVRLGQERFDPEKFIFRCHIIIWPSFVIISILPFFSNSYGPAGGWCWIKDSTPIDRVWRMVCFYMILEIVFVYLVYVYSRLYWYINYGDELPDNARAMLRRVIVFPMVIFVCYFFGILRRVLEVGGNHTPFWLAAMHIGPSSLLGLCNAIVYGTMNTQLQQEMKKMCCVTTDSENIIQSNEPCIQMQESLRRKTVDSVVETHIDE